MSSSIQFNYFLCSDLHFGSPGQDKKKLKNAFENFYAGKGAGVVVLDEDGKIFAGKELGQNFIVDGKAYTICDPTYLNAPIGSVMPRYKDYKPQAIKINNNNKLNNIWQHITQTIEANNKNKIFCTVPF